MSESEFSDASWEDEGTASFGSKSPRRQPARRRSARPASDDGLSLAERLHGVLEAVEDVCNEACGDTLTFELQPALRLKLRKRTPLLTLGVNYLGGPPGSFELVAKRGSADLPLWKARRRPLAAAEARAHFSRAAQLVRRVVASPEGGDVRVHRRGTAPVRPLSPALTRTRSVALPLGPLAVEGVYSHDWRTHASRLHWRLCASWDVGPRHVGNKQALPSPLPCLKPTLRWDVRTLAPPEVEGQLGEAGGVAYDVGHFHFSLPSLQATLEL